MVTQEQITQFKGTFDKCSHDVWETLMFFRQDVVNRMLTNGMPPEQDNPIFLAEAAVLWMLKKYHDDHIEMAKAQSFIDEMFPNKTD